MLDNTYPTRRSRNEVIEAAWERGLATRCIWLRTELPDAQVNAIRRMVEVHGSLPAPEDIRALSRTDTRYLLPDAQFRYERTLEPPGEDEGFERVDERRFARTPSEAQGRALIMDLDHLVGGDGSSPRDSLLEAALAESLRRRHAEGWTLFVFAWRPQVAREEMAAEDVDAAFAALRARLGVPVHVASCPHDAGPPACWCRKPIPGRVIEFADRERIDLTRSVVVGSSAADRTMAERVGARFGSLDDVRRV